MPSTDPPGLREDADRLRQAHAALESSDERYRDLYENAPVGYLTTDVADGVIRQANRMAMRILGRTAEHLIGRPLVDFLLRDERPRYEAIQRDTVAGRDREPVQLRFIVEGDRRPPGGGPLPLGPATAVVELAMSLMPRNGAAPQCRVTLVDLTTESAMRERAEQALHKRMRQLDLLTQAGQALIMGDADDAAMPTELFDRVRLAIGCEVCLSYTIGEVPGTLRMVGSQGLSRARREAMAVVGLDSSLCGLAAARRAPLIVEDLAAATLLEAVPLRDEGLRCYAGFPLIAHGEVLGVAAFGSTTRHRFREGDLQIIQAVCDQASAMLERGRLIEALHERERLLRIADRRKDDFIATLAHELRNPLAPIRNAVDILRRPEVGKVQVDWCREVIQRQVMQMTHLLEDLLDVSRVTRNKIELRRECVEVRRIVEDAIETTQPLIQAQRHQLVVSLPQAPVVVYGDPTRLTQVLANLLNNAAKYTDPDGRIELDVQVDGEQVHVTVHDNGIGIDAMQLPHVFEMFSQLEPALHRSHGGLGIGLSLSRGLVELHGGRLDARSAGIGRGSEFTIELPIAHALPEFHAPHDQDEVLAAGVRVLVVDDNADAAQTLATMLTLQGMEARAAFGGREGLELAERWRPQVVVVDIGMPEINGYELIRRLRDQAWGDAVLAIACTGWGQSEDRERARLAGFDHHLVKPIEPDAVRRLVAHRHERPGLPA